MSNDPRPSVEPSTRGAQRPPRADAQRNRERLLDAAIELILEVGGEPTRDTLAERAGVGIGTLYRHFPDSQSLLRGVVRHALERSIAAGEVAVATAPDSFAALRQYMHAAIDHGIGVVNVVLPLLKERHPDLRSRAESLIHALLARAHRDGVLRSDASPADIVFATIRFSRPLAVGLPGAVERAMAHRHVDIYLDGLRSDGLRSSGSLSHQTREKAGGARAEERGDRRTLEGQEDPRA